MHRAARVGLWIAVPALLLAADVLAQWGWSRDAFEDSCYQFVRSDSYIPIPAVPAPLRVLAAGQRKAAVEALGARAKAYYASEAFKRRWTQEHGGQYRDPDEASRKAQNAAAQKQAEAQAAKGLSDMEQMIPMMPPAVQAQMRAELAKARASQAKEQAKADAKAAKGTAPRETAAVPDAKVALRQALQRFLRASEGVDFDAPLTHRENRSFFSNRAYEAKPEAWKACYRAGRTATEAARAYAKAWLAELN